MVLNWVHDDVIIINLGVDRVFHFFCFDLNGNLHDFHDDFRLFDHVIYHGNPVDFEHDINKLYQHRLDDHNDFAHLDQHDLNVELHDFLLDVDLHRDLHCQ
jgi:hypothetical protein